MGKNTSICLRIDGQLKSEAEGVLRQLGLSTSEAIKIFLSAVRINKGLPFPVQLENQQTFSATQALSSRRGPILSLRGKYGNMTSSEEIARRKQEEMPPEKELF